MSAEKTKTQRLRELKNYLVFLKDQGYRDIPLEKNIDKLNFDSEIINSQSDTLSLTPESAITSQNLSMELNAILKELGDCKRCKLCEGRTNIVFGSGNPNADLVFVGEGPGADEDEQGLPFVGKAGKKLTEIIEKGMGMNRERDTYICNIIKCRPPGNRNPEKDEISACKPFMQKQIHCIKPKVIVALGRPSASTLLGRPVTITKERGNWFNYEGVPLMLTYHPAYLLRAYTLENRRAVFEDMQKVLKVLGK
tara:strand:+ start:602 stop:1357 length:756 start_codon:yes stop_codon:yes gene_type:complete